MLAFVQVVAPELVLVVVVLWILAALFFIEFVLLPVMDWLNKAKLPWWKKALVWPVKVLRPRVNSLIRKLKSYLANHLVVRSPPVARWLHAQALVVEQLSGHIAADALWTYEALVYVRRTLVPTLIEKAVAPVRVTAQTALKEERAIKVQLDTARKYVNGRLSDLPWGTGVTFELALYQWSGAFKQLWNEYYKQFRPNWRQFFLIDWPTLRDAFWRVYDDIYLVGADSLPSIRLRLGKIEQAVAGILSDPLTWLMALLGTAIIPAISGGAFRNGLNRLFCRNTQTVTEAVCAADEGLIDDALGLVLAGFAWAGICELSELMATAARAFEPELHLAVTVGVRGTACASPASAPSLPLRAQAPPSGSVAISL